MYISHFLFTLVKSGQKTRWATAEFFSPSTEKVVKEIMESKGWSVARITDNIHEALRSDQMLEVAYDLIEPADLRLLEK